MGFYNTERPHSTLAGRTRTEAYGAGRPMDMMDKPGGLPTSPQAQQQQQDVVNGILAASSDAGIHLNFAVDLSNILGPPHNIDTGYGKPYARVFGASVLKLKPRQTSAAIPVVGKSETSA